MHTSTVSRLVLLVLALMILLPGCSQLNLGQLTQGANTPPAQPQAETQSAPVAMDFDDVLIPPQLKRSAGESFISNGYGRLMLSGRLDGESLAKFFISGMPTTGWQYLDEYKYSGNIKLFFTKPDKVATVLVMENPLDTKVEIWVSPLKPH